MIRKKILGVAILAAFSLSVAGIAQAGTFVNADATSGIDNAGAPPSFDGASFESSTETLVLPATAVTDGITYAAEMFQGTGITIPDNGGDNTKGQYAAVLYIIDGDITKDFRLTYTLSNGAQFDGDPIVSIAGGLPTEFDCTNGTDCVKEDGGSGDNFVTYTIIANTNNLTNGEGIALAYRLKNTGALATPGEQIEMTVKLETYPLAIKVAPSRTISVAQSKAALGDLKILPEEGGSVKISVSSGQTEFVGENPAGGTGAYVSTDEVILGYIEINQVTNVKARDGVTDWTIGTGEGLVVEGSTTTLSITEGQFAASASGSGQVYFMGDNSGATPSTGSIVANEVIDVDGTWTATWELSNATLQNIATDTAATPQRKIMIRMKVDGTNEINVTENPPVATLNIDFDEDFMEDITDIAADLRRFRLDGTVCTLYNIPGGNAPDVINIRITNDTNASGTVTIGMWGEDGTELIASGTPLLSDGATGDDVLQAYASWHISAADLESLAGGPWTRRAIVTLSSTLSKLEAFALLRHKTTGINSNLSGGASGNACPDD